MPVALPPAAVRPSMVLFSRWAFSPRADWPARRRRVELGLAVPGAPSGTTIVQRELGGVPCEELRPREVHDDLTILYLHGGGYCVGSTKSYRGFLGRLARAAGARIVAVDYRLAPEHPWPAQLDDARAAFAALAEETDPSRIVVAGDSAGGGLSLLLALDQRDAGGPVPGALGLVCPWVDARPGTTAARGPAPKEPILSRTIMGVFTDAWLGGTGADPTDPRVSPLLADLQGLPPVVLQTGEDDLLTPSDGLPLLAELREAGVPVDHQDLQGLWHVPHLSSHLLGPAVLDRLAAGLRTAVSTRVRA
jgi:epsilon-lactone hydrolase